VILDLFNPRPEGADALEQGFYLVKMRRSGRIDVPLRIWFGPPEDPETRHLPMAERAVLDRSWRWQLEINGVLFGDEDNPPHIAGRPILTLEGIWPEAKAEPIDQADYEYRVARADYAESWDENDPYGGTGARVDPMTATLPEYRP
jgi:hypothetical protein